jgi:hypothetical protein
MKTLSMVTVLIAIVSIASVANAGTLWRGGISGCDRDVLSFDLHWAGPWPESDIFLEWATPSGPWSPYLGYLPWTATTVVKGGRKYRMMAQPVGGSAYKAAGPVNIPAISCGIDP